ncbi:MAG: hypothetical protein LUO93_10365 [Methanomicrobiales archaeon]|nr:hypothetical protein [Methanomicrobiales archaeon]MDD1679569.1 hypothetical protein [Methanomicrobiales archaeon]
MSPNLTGPIPFFGEPVAQQNFIRNIVLAIAAVITVGLFFLDVFYGAMAVIILGVLFMSFRIMGETTHFPDVIASLPEDARGIILRNRGNETAQDIHVTLVPQNLEFDLPNLEADATHIFALPNMIESVKVLLTYKNQQGHMASRTFRLSSIGEKTEEEDPLKPVFPMFGWKK